MTLPGSPTGTAGSAPRMILWLKGRAHAGWWRDALQMKPRRIGLFGLVFAGIASALPAQATPFCDQLDASMAAAGTVDARAEAVQITLPGNQTERATCSFSIDLSGARSTNCRWAFGYREQVAADAFAALLRAASVCAGSDIGVTSDQKVNHPDFYDLRVLQVADGEVGLSLKDKAALQQTYVFLRTTPAGPDRQDTTRP